MPCWPDIWSRVVYEAGPVSFLVVTALMLWAPAIRWRWLRILLRCVGGAAAFYVLLIVSFGMFLNSGVPKPQYRTLKSPNGLHQATLMYSAGFLGRDFSSVTLTNSACCKHFTVYEYEGPSDLTGTAIVWLDDSHFQIQYHTDHDRYQHCETWVSDIIIICKDFTELSEPLKSR
jgi:hypothetical protein